MEVLGPVVDMSKILSKGERQIACKYVPSDWYGHPLQSRRYELGLTGCRRIKYAWSRMGSSTVDIEAIREDILNE